MVTVAIPAYKSRFLPQAIESVLNQTYGDFELLIVNDASPENVPSVVSQFRDPRICYYENPSNLGRESVVKVWNRCLDLAKRELFVLFSDDDFYESNYLQELVGLTQKYPLVNVFRSRVRIADQSGSTVRYNLASPEHQSCIDFIWQRVVKDQEEFIGEFMFRTEALRRRGGFIDLPLAWGSDDATCMSMALDHGIANSPKPLFTYRESSLSISSAGSLKVRLQAMTLYSQWFVDFMHDKVIPSAEEKDMWNQIVAFFPQRDSGMRAQLLARAPGTLVRKLFRALFLYSVAGNSYSLSTKTLLRACFRMLRSSAWE